MQIYKNSKTQTETVTQQNDQNHTPPPSGGCIKSKEPKMSEQHILTLVVGPSGTRHQEELVGCPPT